MFQLNHYVIRNKKCYPVTYEQAVKENEIGGDVYWTPNNFKDFGLRKKEDLTEITSFFCEIDTADKNEQIKKIVKTIRPSNVIETKRGYHIYWYLKNPIDCRKDPVAKADWFRDILKNRICPALGADTQAADACRLLRVPFFKYWKDGVGDFVINVAYDSDALYEVDDILAVFKERIIPQRVFEKQEFKTDSNSGEGFWTKANRLDPMECLKVLSGSSLVNGEVFSFKKQKDCWRICVHNKPINAWIDRDNKIGSTDGGGPAISNWLYWYHRDWKTVAKILKEVFKI